MRSILSMFAKSPFKPLVSHMDKVRSCVDQLKPLLEAQISGDHEKVITLSERIHLLEHEADTIKNDIRGHLPQSMFLAVDKRDFMHLLSAQDDIADAVEDLTVIFSIKKIDTPSAIKEPLLDLVDHVAFSAYSACDLINEIDNLLEASFGGVEADKVEAGCQKLAEYEWNADKKQLVLAKVLFSLGDSISCPDLILWNEVSKKLGNVADEAEKIGKTLRVFLAK